MVKFKPGPSSIPIPEEIRQLLIHWKYINGLSLKKMAAIMKIGEQVLARILHDKGGAQREAHMRVMRYAHRLQKKGITQTSQGKEATMRNPPESIPE